MIPIKCCVCGVTQTGKSSIISNLLEENQANIINNNQIKFTHDGVHFLLNFLETTTCPKDASLYDIFIFVIDLTLKKSYADIIMPIKKIVEDIKSQHMVKKLIVVGNKADTLKKAVTPEDIEKIELLSESIEYVQTICHKPLKGIDKVNKIIKNFLIENTMQLQAFIQPIQLQQQSYIQDGLQPPPLQLLTSSSLGQQPNQQMINPPPLHILGHSGNNNFPPDIGSLNNQFNQYSYNQQQTQQFNQFNQEDQQLLQEIQQQAATQQQKLNTSQNKSQQFQPPQINQQDSLNFNISPIKNQSQQLESSDLDFLKDLGHSAKKSLDHKQQPPSQGNMYNNNDYQEIDQFDREIASQLTGSSQVGNPLTQTQGGPQQQMKKSKFQPPNRSSQSNSSKYAGESQHTQSQLPKSAEQQQQDLRKEKLIVNIFKESSSQHQMEQTQPPHDQQQMNHSQLTRSQQQYSPQPDNNRIPTVMLSQTQYQNQGFGQDQQLHQQAPLQSQHVHEDQDELKREFNDLFGQSQTNKQHKEQLEHQGSQSQHHQNPQHLSKKYQDILENNNNFQLDDQQKSHKYSKSPDQQYYNQVTRSGSDMLYNNEYSDSPTIQKEMYGGLGHDFSFQEEETDPYFLKAKSASFDNLMTTPDKLKKTNHQQQSQYNVNESNSHYVKTERSPIIHSVDQGKQIRCVPSFKMDLGTEEIFQVQQQEKQQHFQRSQSNFGKSSNVKQTQYNNDKKGDHQRQKSWNNISNIYNNNNEHNSPFRQENQINRSLKSSRSNLGYPNYVNLGHSDNQQHPFAENKEIMRLQIYIDGHLEILDALESDTAYSLVHKLLHKLNLSPKLTTIKHLVEIIQNSINQYCSALDNYVNNKKLYNNYKSLHQFCVNNLNFLNDEILYANKYSHHQNRSHSNLGNRRGQEVGKLYVGTHKNNIGILHVFEKDNAYDLAEQFIIEKSLGHETYDYLVHEILRIQNRWFERYGHSSQERINSNQNLSALMGSKRYDQIHNNNNNDITILNNIYLKRMMDQYKNNNQCIYHNNHNTKHNTDFDYLMQKTVEKDIIQAPIMQSRIINSLENHYKQNQGNLNHFLINIDIGKGNIIQLKINKEDSILKIVQKLTIKYKLTREKEQHIVDILQKNYDRVFRIVRKK